MDWNVIGDRPARLVGSPAHFIPEDLVNGEAGLTSAGRVAQAGYTTPTAVGFVERVDGQMDVLVASSLEAVEALEVAAASASVKERVSRRC